MSIQWNGLVATYGGAKVSAEIDFTGADDRQVRELAIKYLAAQHFAPAVRDGQDCAFVGTFAEMQKVGKRKSTKNATTDASSFFDRMVFEAATGKPESRLRYKQTLFTFDKATQSAKLALFDQAVVFVLED